MAEFRELAACEDCGTRFSLFTRRHHCRACGGSFCNRHAPVHPQRQLRLCDDCRDPPEPSFASVMDAVPSDGPLAVAHARALLDLPTEGEHAKFGFVNWRTGFLPAAAPLLALPAGYEPWDELAARLPRLIRAPAELRRRVARMPAFDGEALPAGALWRAATVLGVVAQAYWLCLETPPPGGELPPALMGGWTAVCRRLERPGTGLSFHDVHVHNYRLSSSDDSCDVRLETARLLVPVFGSQTEHVFTLSFMEILDVSAPAVGALVRAQEAALADDADALVRELGVIHSALDAMTDSFRKIDVNETSPNYCDPVEWGKSVAPFAVSIRPEAGVPGVSGASFPVMAMLDRTLGRERWETIIGREAQREAAWLPPRELAFVEAVSRVSLRDYVLRRGDGRLTAAFNGCVEAYSGDTGFLGVHRTKAYGFLHLAFKASSRVVTTGGSSAAESARATEPWHVVQEQLALAQGERRAAPWPASHCPMARVRAVEPAARDVAGVELDTAPLAAQARPGDRACVWARNPPALVDRVLAALALNGDEPITLDAPWLAEARRGRARPELIHDLPVREFLARAALGPALGKDADAQFGREMLATVGVPLVSRACALLQPLGPRMYSVGRVGQGRAQLTVARAGGTSRALTASPPPEELEMRVVPAGRFRPPACPAAPLVMFAGGAGVGPFRGFPVAPGSLLFIGARTADQVCFADEWAALEAEGRLRLFVALSREDGGVRVPDLVEQQAALLRAKLQSADAHLYVCGSTGFGTAVVDALRRVLGAGGEARLFRLYGERRLQLDLFSQPCRGPEPLPAIAVSELVQHNAGDSLWMAVRGRVFDVTGFASLHPGGRQLIRLNAGTDATAEWDAVEHERCQEARAMLEQCLVGRLDAADSPWVAHAYRVTETQNLLEIDFRSTSVSSLAGGAAAPPASDYVSFAQSEEDDDDGEAALPALRGLRDQLQTQQRFLNVYVNGALPACLRALPGGEAVQADLEAALETPEFEIVSSVVDDLRLLLAITQADSFAADGLAEMLAEVRFLVTTVHDANRALCDRLKRMAVAGLRAAEDLIDGASSTAGDVGPAARAIEGHYRMLAELLRGRVGSKDAKVRRRIQRVLPGGLSTDGASARSRSRSQARQRLRAVTDQWGSAPPSLFRMLAEYHRAEHAAWTPVVAAVGELYGVSVGGGAPGGAPGGGSASSGEFGRERAESSMPALGL